MATNQMNGAIQHLRRVLQGGAGSTDGQLLHDYIVQKWQVDGQSSPYAARRYVLIFMSRYFRLPPSLATQ